MHVVLITICCFPKIHARIASIARMFATSVVSFFLFRSIASYLSLVPRLVVIVRLVEALLLLSAMVGIMVLRLNGNQLTGHIPSELGRLTPVYDLGIHAYLRINL